MSGTLFVVATPIGNLEDITLRALRVLREADVIAAEDTRRTARLLVYHGIATRTLSFHEHNTRSRMPQLLGRLEAGERVALVTDAGTPGVSDPGGLLVQAAHRASVSVVPIPGPSAASAAVSASGFRADGYLFAGFLPATRAARRKALGELATPFPVVFYEAPHRVLETVEDLAERFGSGHEIVIARELTKKFEEIARMPLGAAAAWLCAGPHRQQGEFVLVLAPVDTTLDILVEGQRVLAVLLESMPASEAARLAARISGAPKNALYRLALERSK